MAGPSIITIGNFDGVHRGHRAILAKARVLAKPQGLPVIALTFDPFPIHILRPGQAPARLSDRDERASLLRQAGADQVLVIEPTAEFLAQEAEDFLRHLAQEFRPLAMVEGANFRFGKGRGGDVRMLAQLGPELGFEMVVVDPVEVPLGSLASVPVSSSLVRWLILEGRVLEAAGCLGRAYSLTGHVIHGEQRGRTLGFPTANLNPGPWVDRVLPADGVYAGLVRLPDGLERPGAISIGHKPTLGCLQRVIEVHVLNHQGDLYDKKITVSWHRWIREQVHFPSISALIQQIGHDVTTVATWWERGLIKDPIDIM